MYSKALLAAAALVASASAFSPAALPMGLRQRSATTSLRMGADRQAPGPQGRGPFDANDAFVLPDGRKYVPGDACSDDIYGAALNAPVVVGDDNKSLVLGAGLIGASILLPTILIKLVLGM